MFFIVFNGLDGLSTKFYLDLFVVIGNDLLQVVEYSRQHKRFISPFNTTFITLIPKLDKPLSFDKFWPMSLYNSICKIISKIIALCLRSFLSEHISLEQFTFRRIDKSTRHMVLLKRAFTPSISRRKNMLFIKYIYLRASTRWTSYISN